MLGEKFSAGIKRALSGNLAFNWSFVIVGGHPSATTVRVRSLAFCSAGSRSTEKQQCDITPDPLSSRLSLPVHGGRVGPFIGRLSLFGLTEDWQLVVFKTFLCVFWDFFQQKNEVLGFFRNSHKTFLGFFKEIYLHS